MIIDITIMQLLKSICLDTKKEPRGGSLFIENGTVTDYFTTYYGTFAADTQVETLHRNMDLATQLEVTRGYGVHSNSII